MCHQVQYGSGANCKIFLGRVFVFFLRGRMMWGGLGGGGRGSVGSECKNDGLEFSEFCSFLRIAEFSLQK